LNNYTEAEVDVLSAIVDKGKARYVCFGKEVAPSTGTPHLQGFMYCGKVRAPKAKKILGPRVHVLVADKSVSCNVDYCRKECVDGVFYEFGTVPSDGPGEGERERWRITKQCAMEGRLVDVDPDIFIRHYGNLKRIASDYMQNHALLEGVCGLWIYGESGIGKSFSVRQSFPKCFPKCVNKWWDGYQGEEVVVMDDLDIGHSMMGHYLKIWSDRYSFIAEIKGSAQWIRPKLFIITSQYGISDIWSDKPTNDALSRRFLEFYMAERLKTWPSSVEQLVAKLGVTDWVRICPEEED